MNNQDPPNTVLLGYMLAIAIYLITFNSVGWFIGAPIWLSCSVAVLGPWLPFIAGPVGTLYVILAIIHAVSLIFNH